MTKELTAEEYRNLHRPLYGSEVVTYGDLRAKEAVEKFAEELIAMNEQFPITMLDILNLAKQKGVEI